MLNGNDRRKITMSISEKNVSLSAINSLSLLPSNNETLPSSFKDVLATSEKSCDSKIPICITNS